MIEWETFKDGSGRQASVDVRVDASVVVNAFLSERPGLIRLVFMAGTPRDASVAAHFETRNHILDAMEDIGNELIEQAAEYRRYLNRIRGCDPSDTETPEERLDRLETWMATHVHQTVQGALTSTATRPPQSRGDSDAE